MHLISFFVFLFFLMWPLLKVCIEFVTILFLGFVGFLAMRHEGSQLPSQGPNLQPLYWKAKS